MSYGFHPAAEAEHLESVAFFESKRPGLGASYLAEFERIIRTVCEAPHRYPVEKQPDVRRIRMKRFPFAVVFREASGCVQVLPLLTAGVALNTGWAGSNQPLVLFCIKHGAKLEELQLLHLYNNGLDTHSGDPF